MGMSKYKRHGDYNQGCSVILLAIAVLFILVLAVEMLASYAGW